MSLRDRIARVLCANSPANTEGSAFEDYAECNQREWLETADAILADPEIAALREVAEAASRLDLLYEASNPGVTIGQMAAHRRHAMDAALARLEEARRG